MNSPLNLARTEMRRILHRRMTWVSAMIAIGIIVVVGIGTFLTHDAAAPDRSAAVAMADLNRENCLDSIDDSGHTQAQLDEMCFQDPAWYLTDDAFHMQTLLSGYHTDSWSTYKQGAGRQLYEGSPFDPTGAGVANVSPASGFDGALIGFGTMMMLAGAAVAASFVGSDWRSRSIETQLTFVPDRRRLLAVKIGVAAFAASTFVLVMLLGLVAALLPSAIWRGDFAGTGGMFWVDVALTGVRIVVATALVAAMAAAVTTIARSTVAGIGLVFGMAIVGAIVASIWQGRLARIELFSNLAAWIKSSDVSRYASMPNPSGGEFSLSLIVHGWVIAGVVVAAYGLVATALGDWSFRRRDIS